MKKRLTSQERETEFKRLTSELDSAEAQERLGHGVRASLARSHRKHQRFLALSRANACNRFVY